MPDSGSVGAQQMPTPEGQGRSESGLQQAAHWATVIASVLTAGSLIFAASTYRESSRRQAETAAVGVLQEYFRLAIEHPELADGPRGGTVDARYEWFASNAMFTAETIYNLTDAPEWRNTVLAIVDLHGAYLRGGSFACHDYGASFVAFVRKQDSTIACAD